MPREAVAVAQAQVRECGQGAQHSQALVVQCVAVGEVEPLQCAEPAERQNTCTATVLQCEFVLGCVCVCVCVRTRTMLGQV